MFRGKFTYFGADFWIIKALDVRRLCDILDLDQEKTVKSLTHYLKGVFVVSVEKSAENVCIKIKFICWPLKGSNTSIMNTSQNSLTNLYYFLKNVFLQIFLKVTALCLPTLVVIRHNPDITGYRYCWTIKINTQRASQEPCSSFTPDQQP